MTMTMTPEKIADLTGNKWIEIVKELGPGFADRSRQHDEEGSFVAENYEEMRQHKLFSARVPAELGGGGATHREMCDMIRELARYDGATALSFAMHSHLLATLVWRHNRGLTPPSEPVLRKIAAEELVLVSTGGSDWLDGSGVATKVEGGFKVSGRKIFGSGSPAGNLMLTTAVYDDPDNGQNVLHFAVNMKGEGVTILDDWDAMGMRGTGSNSVMLQDVFVPEAGVSVSRPKGRWAPFFDVISPIAWSLVMSAYLGVAEAARDIAIAQASKKQGDSIVQELVGEMDTELLSAQIALEKLVEIPASDSAPSIENSDLTYKYKTILTRASIRTVDKAIEVTGGSAYFRGLGLEQRFRDIQAARFHPFQERKQYVFSGRIALGLAPTE